MDKTKKINQRRRKRTEEKNNKEARERIEKKIGNNEKIRRN